MLGLIACAKNRVRQGKQPVTMVQEKLISKSKVAQVSLYCLQNKTKQKDDLVLDPCSQISKTAFPDPAQLLRMRMKCIAGDVAHLARQGLGHTSVLIHLRKLQ